MFKWTRDYFKWLEITGITAVFFDVCLMFVEVICGTFGSLRVGTHRKILGYMKPFCLKSILLKEAIGIIVKVYYNEVNV